MAGNASEAGATRLIFEQMGDDLRLVGRFPVSLGADLVEDGPIPAAFLELRDAQGEALAQVPVDPQVGGVEYLTGDPERPIGRVDGLAGRIFSIIVPDLPDAVEARLVRTLPQVPPPEPHPAASPPIQTAVDPALSQVAVFRLPLADAGEEAGT